MYPNATEAHINHYVWLVSKGKTAEFPLGKYVKENPDYARKLLDLMTSLKNRQKQQTQQDGWEHAVKVLEEATPISGPACV